VIEKEHVPDAGIRPAEGEGKSYGFLLQSFEDFNEATLRLQKAFRNLEKKFEDINRELEMKNIELEKTVAEKEDVKNYLLNILESLTTGVLVADLEGKIATLNRCAEGLLGCSQEAALGRSVEAVLPEIASPGAEEPIGRTGRKIRVHERSIEVVGSPMKAKDGGVMGRVLILRDVTRIEKLEEMAKRTEKFAAMGEMAATIAHEIRNPLGSIELFASLLMKDCRGEKDRERLSQIISAVKGMDNKISNLMLFTRKQNPLMRTVDLHGALREVIEFSEQIVRQKGIALCAKYARGRPCILGDAEMLKQVFLNLVLNAVQAMPGGGRLGIETSLDRSGPESAVEVRCSDTGIGIPEEHLKRIFDPFFTGREEGTGLGLAIVHNIVDTHQGSIDVESGSGGTLFRIAFPLFRKERPKPSRRTGARSR